MRFRDDFADAVCEVEELEQVIESVINKGNIPISELQDMREKVLSFPDSADEAAAGKINEICSSR